MTQDDSNKEAAGILRGIKDRIERLEQAVSSTEGIPNLLRSVSDTATSDDTATVSTSGAGGFTWDQDSWDQERWQ